MNVKNLVDELISHGDDLTFSAWEALITKRLSEDIDHYSWVGFYWVEGEELVLGSWNGPEATEHLRIPIGAGICGLAARTKETVIVDDVNSREDYIACFINTHSEIVVPILQDGVAIGEIDIDGDRVAAFKEEDKIELERLAVVIAEKFTI
jgi:L-methionine (R)-S-oxide reductase